jgi:hypothetical protein
MTENEKTLFMKTVGKFVAQRIVAFVGPLNARVVELESKLANFRYAGVWSEGTRYQAGNFVTHDGSLFHCNLDTTNRPGKDPVAWSLCCKRGQDGRDAVHDERDDQSQPPRRLPTPPRHHVAT